MSNTIDARQADMNARAMELDRDAKQRADDLLAWRDYARTRETNPFAASKMRTALEASIERGRALDAALPPPPAPAPPPPPPGLPTKEEMDKMNEFERARTRLRFPHFDGAA